MGTIPWVRRLRSVRRFSRVTVRLPVALPIKPIAGSRATDAPGLEILAGLAGGKPSDGPNPLVHCANKSCTSRRDPANCSDQATALEH